MNWTTTTPKGTEGFNISYKDEEYCADELLKYLPEGWAVHTSWHQILFVDVGYEIDFPNKVVNIDYCQNLLYWYPDFLDEIVEKVAANEKAPKQKAPLR